MLEKEGSERWLYADDLIDCWKDFGSRLSA